MSIVTKNITKKYGEQTVLNNVSINIKKGEIVGLLGPNGAGKSTLMKILTCYIPPTSGEAFVCGNNIYEDSDKIKSIIGYLPETNPLYHDMYIREYLEFIANVHKIKNKKQTIEKIIEITGLSPEIRKKIGMLSKGFRQRVGLAQALMHDPEVLILDEPTSGLDPNQLIEIRRLISEIGKEKTVMLSSHIMQEIEAVCSRFIIINNGNIVADKKIDEVGGVQQTKTLVVEFSEKVLKNELMNIPNIDNIFEIADKTFKITSKDNIDIRKDINSFAVKKGILIQSLNYETDKLEDIFHKLTK